MLVPRTAHRRPRPSCWPPAGRIVVAPLDRGCILPGGQAGPAGRGRPHRPAPHAPPARAPPARRPALLRGPQGRRPRRAPPPRRRPLRRHGHPGHGRGGARLPAARVPRRRQALRPVGPDRHHPALLRRRDPDAQPDGRRRLRPDQGQGALGGGRDRPGAGGALPDPAATPPATPSPRTRPWQREMEAAFPFQETPDQLLAIADVKADMESHRAHGPPGVRRRRLRQDRGGDAGRVQGGAGRQAGGGAGAHHAAGPAALPDLLRPLRRVPGPGGGALPLPHHRPRPGRSPRARHRRGGRGHRHPPAAVRGRDVQEPGPAGGRRGAALRRAATRRPSSSSRPTWTCSPSPPRPSPAPWR